MAAGAWQTRGWHTVTLNLLLHLVLYGLAFLVCAFFAARQFRRARNPVRRGPADPCAPYPLFR
jgi:hypothetical protein